MESRYILGQQALTPDGAIYQIIIDAPYNENTTPDAVAPMLSDEAPEDTVAGSTCIFNTEDADGYPVEWLFAFDGTNWALDRVVRGGSAGGGGASTADVTFLAVKGEYVVTYPCVDNNGRITVRRDGNIKPSSPVTARIPLGDEGTLINLFNHIQSTSIVTTGKISHEISATNVNCIVRGDGTITIEGTASPK